MLIEKGCTNNQIQQGITEKFKALVVIRTKTAMCQRLLQQLRIFKLVGECGLQLNQIRRHF